MGDSTPYNLKREWTKARTRKDRGWVILQLIGNVPFHIMMNAFLGFVLASPFLLGGITIWLCAGSILTTLIFVDFWGLMWRGKVYGLIGQKYMKLIYRFGEKYGYDKKYVSMCKRAGIL